MMRDNMGGLFAAIRAHTKPIESLRSDLREDLQGMRQELRDLDRRLRRLERRQYILACLLLVIWSDPRQLLQMLLALL